MTKKTWGSSLKRKTPLKRGTFQRSKRPKDFKQWGKVGFTKKRKPMRKVAKAKARKLKDEYGPARIAFLRLFERCEVCISITIDATLAEVREITHGEHARHAATLLVASGAAWRPSTEVHHFRGRAGKLLSDPRYFIATCRECREQPHDHPKWAKANQLIAHGKDWCVVDRDPDSRGLLPENAFQALFDKIEESACVAQAVA